VLIPPIPAGAVVFDLAAPPAPATNPIQLAAALLTARFSVPPEPNDANGAVTCPNSFMSNGASQPLITLCWRGNHNPFGSSALGAVAPRSAWDSLVGAIGIPTPTASPVHVLRTVTTVTFPISTTIVP
jgi:hypothetical protein